MHSRIETKHEEELQRLKTSVKRLHHHTTLGEDVLDDRSLSVIDAEELRRSENALERYSIQTN